MAPLAAVKEAAPPTVSAVLAAWLMLPAAVMLSAPLLTATLPRLRARLLARAALPAALVERVTVPVSALAALARLMEPLLAVTPRVPLTARLVLAACEMLPWVVIAKFPANVEELNASAVLSISMTLTVWAAVDAV